VSNVTRIPHVPRPSRISAYVAARLGSPVIDPGTVTDMLRCYDLEVAGPLRNLRLGRRSLNVAVTTSSGRRVLKLYRPQWTQATVRYGHSILLHLERQNVPTTRLVRTWSGETLVTRGDRVFALFEFVPGVNYSLNYLRRPDRLRLTRIAAETLAELHLRLEGFVPTGEHHLGFASTAGPRRRDAAWQAAKLEELRRRSPSLDDRGARGRVRVLCDRSSDVLGEIRRLDGQLAAASLPRLVIHGDYGLHNLIFQSTAAVPLDFEVSRLDWRINDLVSALGKYRYRAGHYDFESMHTFMYAYTARFPLTREEMRLLPSVWRLYKLHAAVQYWNSYFETGGPVRKLDAALDSIEQSEWVMRHTDLIESLASSGCEGVS
jgi:Ser/Thr protein kinase RdoA (MazF antagonist)